MHAGNFVLNLHTHLPYVLHHGDWPHGTDWLCEAVAECYLPLINVFHELLDEGITPKVTLDISPVLCEQLEHPDFQKVFRKYCDDRIAAATRDEKSFSGKKQHEQLIYMARYWKEFYSARKEEFFGKYECSVVSAFRELQDRNAIEMITCGLTHGYLPLLGDDKSVEIQVRAAVENYKKHFGRQPRGMWLPECAYRPSYTWKSYLLVDRYSQPRHRPGVEEVTAKHGIEYFFVDQHTTEGGRPLGKFADGSFRPIFSPDFNATRWNFDRSPMSLYNIASTEDVSRGTAIAFTRHKDISMQVWSAENGYPGNPVYLDFHKKHEGSMLRYWRVTDVKADMAYKLLYMPEWTQGALATDAQHFANAVEKTIGWYHHQTGKTATLCTPFDTELFGHWWFEGPQFLKEVLRNLSRFEHIKVVTASEQVDFVRPSEVMAVPESTWGAEGGHNVWSNADTIWTWERVYNAELRMDRLLEKFFSGGNTGKTPLRRILTQALKELLLLESSDWQFLISTLSARDYAERRVMYHNTDFHKLCDLAESCASGQKLSADDKKYLEETEKRNSVFKELELEWWKNPG